MKTVKNFARSSVVAAGVLASGFASAAVDITAATAEAKTDIGTAGALILGVVVAVAAVSWLRRVIK